jgi:dynactin 1
MATVRSAKVISGKAIRQLEELESRSLTLEPSTLSTIEQSQALTLDIVEVSRLSGLSLCKLINEEDRKSPFTYDEIARALSANDSSPFFTLSSKAQAAAVQMQAFHNLTTTLTQTTEFPSPSPSPPWEVLSQILKAETTATVEFEKDIGRLKDELCEKNTALAMKDKIVEEMCVNVEVLEKRISESGGRKERLKELEIAIEASSVQEKGLNQRISRLEEQLASQKSDIESYSSQVSQFRRQEGSSLPSTGTPRDGIVPVRALEDIAVLKNQLSSLQATIKYLHQSTHQQSLASAYSFLDTPLVPKAGISKEARLAHEARDALRSMLELVTRPESTIVQLRKRDRGDRLAWRSKHDEPKCQVRKQREKWEVWREWKDDVGKQRVEMAKEMERMKVVGRKREEIGEVLARVDMRILGIGFEKVEGGTVQIVKPDDWEGIERRLGLAF